MSSSSGMTATMMALLSLCLTASAYPLGHLASTGITTLITRGLVSPTNAELLHNTIAFGTAAVFCFILRLINRGWVLAKFHLEDYLMCVSMCFYINLLVLINVSANYATNLYPPEQEAAILDDPQQVHDRIFGSKLVIPLEQSMIASTWGVKTCIWVFLLRLCRNLPQYEFALWCLFYYIWVGFLVIEVVYYGVFCRPFSQYWAVPVKNMECATYHNYSIVQMVFNISSDAGLIIIPAVMISGSRLPRGRKLVLLGIFALAGFTILAAVLNKYYNFKSPLTTVYQLWYIREASVAVIVGNLICTWQLLQKLFNLRSFDNKHANIVDDAEIPHFLANREGDNMLNAGNGRARKVYERARRAMLGSLGSFATISGAGADRITVVVGEKGPRGESTGSRESGSVLVNEGQKAKGQGVEGQAQEQSQELEVLLNTGNANKDEVRSALDYREVNKID